MFVCVCVCPLLLVYECNEEVEEEEENRGEIQLCAIFLSLGDVYDVRCR